jgi:hypothetical protein
MTPQQQGPQASYDYAESHKFCNKHFPPEYDALVVLRSWLGPTTWDCWLHCVRQTGNDRDREHSVAGRETDCGADGSKRGRDGGICYNRFIGR